MTASSRNKSPRVSSKTRAKSCAGLRLLEQSRREEEEKLVALCALAAVGFDDLDQGRGIVLADGVQLAEFIAEAGRQAANRTELTPGSK